jgi:NAD(P)-dependent dehydrogenase (short-subunit alcohol dehydrogenase family)
MMGDRCGEKVLESPKIDRIGAAEDIAAMAALLLSDEGGFVTGEVTGIDDGKAMRP